ncbi:MAG: M20/M25/M40 family metallo-hydrolase [Alphaproteobacteria bacterium]|nr:M20/M25/M40 family metallo-hydrolase [Alphaproteobacteria bacterium]
MNSSALRDFSSTVWDKDILPALCEFVRIPCLSPMFDAEWLKHGHIDAAMALFDKWTKEKIKKLSGATFEIICESGRTPLIFIDVPGTAKGTTLLYGHIDKQPESCGWSPELGPWNPVVKNDKLYGRGSVDDGYAMFSAIASLLALEEQKLPHARCVILIEASEESGSTDIPFYMDRLKDRIGTVDLVICLDSECCTYDRLWLTTSLRGLVGGDLSVRILTHGVHSGAASGVVPSSFRILRALLSRIEDEATGQLKIPEACAQIPPDKLKQLESCVGILGDSIHNKFPFVQGAKPMGETLMETALNKAWKPQLAVTGMDGYPKPETAGNVLLPYTTARLSMRTPPGCDANKLFPVLKELLEKDPPHGAQVSFENANGTSGWNSPPLAPWLGAALENASSAHFGNSVAFVHLGASIGFIGMLADMYPAAQFVVTGVSGPGSNPHGPDESLDIPAVKKLTACIAEILAAQASA